MTLGEALQAVTRRLHSAGIDDAGAEAELLLGHALSISRTHLYTEPERGLTWTETRHLRRFVRRRLDREPAAYILGQCGFYGLDFYVDHHTLIPRPETELLVEQAVQLALGMQRPGKRVVIADIGTGCGAIAISLAMALPEAIIYATDISVAALRVARMNCRRHAVNGRVELLSGSLLEPLSGRMDLIVANLPYVGDHELQNLSPEITNFEPAIALAGGRSGLDKIQQLLEQMPAKLNYDACFLLEVGQGQAVEVTSLISSHFPRADVECIPDPGGIPRVVKAVL